MWRLVLFGMVLGAFLGFSGGFIVGLYGHPELAPAVGALLGWLGSIVMSIVVMRIILQKRFPNFTIQLIGVQRK